MNDSMSGSSPQRSCDEWADVLALTPEDQLSPADRVAFTEHARLCTTCAALRDDSRLLTTFARRALRVIPTCVHRKKFHMGRPASYLIGVLSLRTQVGMTPLPNLPDFLLAEIQKASSASSEEQSGLKSRKTGTQLGTRRIPRLQSSWRLIATCLLLGTIVSLVWQLAFPTPIHEVQASPLSLQQSLMNKVMKPPPGTTFVHTVSWSPNGKYIAVLWDDSTMEVRDAQNNYTVIFSQKAGLEHGLAWSYDSRYLAYPGSEDNTIQIWNSLTPQSIATYRGQSAQVEAIAWSPNDDNAIASASDDHTVQVWDTHTMKLRYKYEDPGSEVKTLAWSPNGKRLVIGDNKNQVLAWDALTGASLVKYPGHTGAITFVGWFPDGTFLLSTSYDGTIQIWNAKTGESVLKRSLPDPDHFKHPSNIFAADSWWRTPTSAYLALVADNSIQIWYLSDQSGKIALQEVTTSSVANQQGQYDNIVSISWSHLEDGNLIAAGSGDILHFRLA
jgi:WD40 repeat protein